MDMSRSIFGLQVSPLNTPHGSPSSCEAAVHDSPIVGQPEAVFVRTSRESGEWASSTSPALNDDSPTLGYDEFPLPPPRYVPRLPAVPLEDVLRRIERERAMTEWSPKRLGKLPAILFENQPDIHAEPIHTLHGECDYIPPLSSRASTKVARQCLAPGRWRASFALQTPSTVTIAAGPFIVRISTLS